METQSLKHSMGNKVDNRWPDWEHLSQVLQRGTFRFSGAFLYIMTIHAPHKYLLRITGGGWRNTDLRKHTFEREPVPEG